MTQRRARLNHDLLAMPLYGGGNEAVTIPLGETLIVENYDHSETDASVTWRGNQYIVNKDSLITFGEPVDIGAQH